MARHNYNRWIFTLLILSPGLCGAQQQCDATEDVNLCKMAMSSSAPTGSGATSSMAGSAANLSVASSAQNVVLQDALDYCQNRKKRCQANCSPDMKDSGQKFNGAPILSNAAVAPINDECRKIVARGHLAPNVSCPGSPLILKFGDGPLELTSQREGVVFDILGQTIWPAHRPVGISWLKPSSLAANYFLVLPDEDGQVLGIDQMFGDNTRGPDNNFAASGFAALRKYDGRLEDGSYDLASQDGQIDSRDPIFSSLRLWHDLNGNGVVDDGELASLADLGVVAIELDTTPFFELDQNGNMLNSRSIFHLNDGSIGLVYDLWFAIKIDPMGA